VQDQLDIVPGGKEIRLPSRAEAVKVLRGGPVETGRGFVLHSADYGATDSTVKIGDNVMAGERLGIIRFGSRVDLYLPPSTLLVSEGQRTLAGETVIADLESQEPHRSFQRI